MGAFRLFLAGMTAYAAFLVATVPAAVVVPRVAGATGGRVALAGASGTVWDGAARASLRLPAATVAVDEVRWSLRPSRLLAGRVAFGLEARAGSIRARAEVSRGPVAWRVADLAAGGDAAALAALLPVAAAWQPAGAIAIEAASLEWDGRQASGTATLEWREAALALSAVRPLGSWRTEATGEGPAFRLSVATAKGPLRLSGAGKLPLPGRLAFSGEARAEPGRERDLEAILDLIGPRRADGARAIEIR
jgi:general secretion pathway protein N